MEIGNIHGRLFRMNQRNEPRRQRTRSRSSPERSVVSGLVAIGIIPPP